MITTGMVSATFREKPAEDIIRLCVENRLSAVEWSENAHVLPDDPQGAALLRQKTEDAGLKIAAYGSYYRLGENENPAETFQKSLVSAKTLGAPVIRIWAGKKPSAEVGEEEFSRLAAEASLIAGLAEQTGIQAAFEWHKNTLTDTNESAVRLLALAAHPNLYCLWQPTDALTMEQRKQGLHWLSQNGRLLNLHVYYWPDGTRHPLAEGIAVWKDYLSQIDITEDRYALIEFVRGNTEQQLADDAQAINRLAAEVNP